MDIFIIVLTILLIGFLCYKGVPTPIGGVACTLILLLYFRMNIYDGLLTTYMGVVLCQDLVQVKMRFSSS